MANKGKLLGVLVVAVAAGAYSLKLYSRASGNFNEMQMRAKRSEAAATTRAIRAAELAYYEAHGRYVQTGVPHPRPVIDLDGEQAPWTADNAGFVELGWEPEHPLRGAYWVTTTGGGFEVHGVIDCDGDGDPAHYVATDSIEVEYLAGPEVY